MKTGAITTLIGPELSTRFLNDISEAAVFRRLRNALTCDLVVRLLGDVAAIEDDYAGALLPPRT